MNRRVGSPTADVRLPIFHVMAYRSIRGEKRDMSTNNFDFFIEGVGST